MKNAIKYFVLGISCVICFVLTFIMVLLWLDIGNLQYPATMILPTISYIFCMGGFVMLTAWAFKFSNNQEHKNFLIICLAAFLASALVYVAVKVVNPIISSEKTEAQAETETQYFDFTVTDFVDTLSEEYSTHLTLISTIPTDDGTKINSYTHGTPGDSSAPMVNYLVTYDDTTEKVTDISFFLNKDFESDIPELALTHYFIHVQLVSSVIEPDIDTDALLEEIITGFNDDILHAALCDREKFTLSAFDNDSYFDALFQPIQNTKGD